MKLLKIVGGLGVLALAIAGLVLWTLPADVAYRQVAQRLGPITLTGLRGTVWNGHADALSVFGRDLGEINWQASKSPLLLGRVAVDLRIKGADVEAAGLLTRNGDGSLHAQDVRFSLPMALLAAGLDAGALKWLGTVNGVLEQATFTQASLRDVIGNLQWTGAGVDGGRDGALLMSDIGAEFASREDGSIGGVVRDDEAGDLAVNGSFSLRMGVLEGGLSPRLGAFDAELVLRARHDNAHVADLLRRIGEPQPDGSSRLVVHDSLLKPL